MTVTQIAHRRAADLVAGDGLWVRVPGQVGHVRGTVERVLPGNFDDLLPPQLAKYGRHQPAAVVHVKMASAQMQGQAQFRSIFGTIYCAPDELVRVTGDR